MTKTLVSAVLIGVSYFRQQKMKYVHETSMKKKRRSEISSQFTAEMIGWFRAGKTVARAEQQTSNAHSGKKPKNQLVE